MVSTAMSNRPLSDATVVVAKGERMVEPAEVEAMLALKNKSWGSKRIAKELGIARNTVKRYLRLGRHEPYAHTPDAVLASQDEWLRMRFVEVGGNVRVLQRELAERGVRPGYSTLTRRLRPERRKLRAEALATLRFETLPGEQAQADFGELFLPIAGVRTKVHFCVVTLGYSRRCFVRAFLTERQEQWLATFDAAFRHFGGVPRELLLDNARALVSGRDKQTGEVFFTEPLKAFCALHGVRPRACRPYRARSKGKVESGVKYVKRNALPGKEFASFAELESWLAQWTREVADVRIHGTTGEQPIARFEAEAAALSPLKAVAPTPLPQRRTVSADCFVALDTNRYSVPHSYVLRTVDVLRQDGHVIIRCDGAEVARHVERRGRAQTSLVAAHVQGLYPRVVAAEPAAPSMEVPAPDLAAYEQLAGGAA